MSAGARALLSRIDVERGRLRSARDVLDRESVTTSDVGSAARASLVLGIDSMDGRLTDLASRTRRTGATRHHVQSFSSLAKATDRVVREAFALAVGVLVRDQGIDGGACAESDRLIAELAGRVDKRLARPTVPGEAEFLHRATDVIRRRLPDHGVWDLPVMAHEFGHVLVQHLQLYDPVEDHVLPLGADVVGGWPGHSGSQGEELFCDLLATYAMGPSYAATLLLHRLDPVADAQVGTGTHPPDASRAAVILEVLTRLTKREPLNSRYRLTVRQIVAAWSGLQASAPDSARLSEQQSAQLTAQVGVALDFLQKKLGALASGWPSAEIRELADALMDDRPPSSNIDYGAPDVLNAAWRLRLATPAGEPLPAHVAARARSLI